MAGIGFELRRLTRAESLGTNVGGLLAATAVSAGPWLFTCAALFAMQAMARPLMDTAALHRFSILIVYDFSFTLVLSGPVVLLVTRLLADAVYARDLGGIGDTLMGALALVLALNGVAAGVLYGLVVDMPAELRVAGSVSMLLTGGIWLVSTFLSALKRYGAISLTFAAGMTVAIAGAAWLLGATGLARPAFAAHWSAEFVLLGSFACGLAVVFFALAAQVIAAFAPTAGVSFGFLGALRFHGGYGDLALVGLCFNAAIWVDKWIMWFAPGAITAGPGLRSHPTYESAMFLSFLGVVPAMAVALITVETRFYGRYVRFYRDIREHATWREIERNHEGLRDEIARGFKHVASLQWAVCLVGIVAAPWIVGAVGGGAELVPVLRYGLFGALFHVLLAMTLSLLAYLDMRRPMLRVAFAFLALNAAFTAASVALGSEFYGYGYGVAALLAFAYAGTQAADGVRRLPYLTFVANNAALRAP